VTWFVNLKINPRSPIFSPLVKLGDASYSLYLLHPIIFLLALRDFNSLPLWTQEPIRWGSILACCGLSYWTWKVFETPMIRMGEALARAEVRLDSSFVPSVDKSIAQVSACLTVFVLARCVIFPLHTPLFLALR
jgi:peptidoglycan/LPS O-acetylase OafA/YrhL